MSRLLQGNLNRRKKADGLLALLVLEKEVDLLVSEQYMERNSPTWFSDTLGTAAIWIMNLAKAHVDNHGGESGFVWVSCHLTPSDKITDFQEKLDLFEGVDHEGEGQMIVEGDLNARALE